MRLVLFDVDGTLVDSQHYIHAAMGYAFASEGLPAPTLAQVRGIVGLSLPVALSALAPGLATARLAKLENGYREAFLSRRVMDDAPLFGGAAASVAALAQRDDVLLGVATGKGRRGLLAMIEHHGFAGAFTTLQCADDHPSKPNPSMILAAMAEVGVGPKATMMIGDTSFDMAMARAAGVAALGVGWGYHAPALLTDAGAQAVAADFGALDAILDNWTSSGTLA